MVRTRIITHRGLQPSRSGHPPEQSEEALFYHLEQGWGLEVDPCLTSDNVVVLMHDNDLKRITKSEDGRQISQLPYTVLVNMSRKMGWTVPTLEHVLQKASSIDSDALITLHIKARLQQNQNDLEVLLRLLQKYAGLHVRLLLFDVLPDLAVVIKKKMPTLLLAPSVAHPYDIERYGSCTGNTLLSSEAALAYGPSGKQLYEWVWLDEWDLTGPEGAPKQFVTQDLVDLMHASFYKIALVTPELHATSPGLLGAESHPDAVSKDKLFARIQEIISFGVDAICTDYPEEVASFVK